MSDILKEKFLNKEVEIILDDSKKSERVKVLSSDSIGVLVKPSNGYEVFVPYSAIRVIRKVS